MNLAHAEDRPPPVHIRNLDPALWREIRSEAIRRNLSVAQLITIAWARYVAQEKVAGRA